MEKLSKNKKMWLVFAFSMALYLFLKFTIFE